MAPTAHAQPFLSPVPLNTEIDIGVRHAFCVGRTLGNFVRAVGGIGVEISIRLDYERVLCRTQKLFSFRGRDFSGFKVCLHHWAS